MEKDHLDFQSDNMITLKGKGSSSSKGRRHFPFYQNSVHESKQRRAIGKGKEEEIEWSSP